MEIPNSIEYNIEAENRDNISADYRNANYKTLIISLPYFEPKIKVKQNYILGKGGIFWDGSYFLTKYIFENILNKDANIKNILELGAGTALPSLACLYKGYNVVTTDLKKFVPFMTEIFEMNKVNFSKDSSFKIEALDWTVAEDIQKVKEYCPKYDLIIGSELIYLDDLFDDLIKVFCEFSNENTIIMLSFKIRLPEMVAEFFEKLEKKFNVEYIEYEAMKAVYQSYDKFRIVKIRKKIE